MTITITAFERSPDGGQGLARDTHVRWALEEVRRPYEVRLVSFRAMKEPAHLALHPFGQIPTYEEGELALFETRAIVFHLAQKHPGLPPTDANGRARAITKPPSQPNVSARSRHPLAGKPPSAEPPRSRSGPAESCHPTASPRARPPRAAMPRC
jgi:hypothetical protein